MNADQDFDAWMAEVYPGGSGNCKGAFYEDDMREAYEAGVAEGIARKERDQ